jgi:hypothetical protein
MGLEQVFIIVMLIVITKRIGRKKINHFIQNYLRQKSFKEYEKIFPGNIVGAATIIIV